ncbi:MAG: ORF6N domain-containing protein [Bacteroidetes bacterium]|nr:MAG: ORF6N domain-containing protein [Bacteroidota bacterium]RLE04396.1 MAG: ORF6N domain-containing protein [Bacteroidota bacterium]
MNKIYLIRGKKVMLDRDLAGLYGVETKVLKQTVRRNIKRFPSDFLFEMTIEELQDWRSQIVTSKADKKGLRYPPFCFTEHGVIMLASVLNSDRAININVQIVRIFTKMREMLSSHKEILHELVKIEHKLAEHDNQILVIFQYLKQLEQVKQQEQDQQNRKRLGYKRKDEQ